MKLPHGGYTPKLSGRPSSVVEEVPLADVLRISLDQSGLPYQPVVANGQRVDFGDRLAEVEAFGGILGLPAPASGRIVLSEDGSRTVVLEDVSQEEPKSGEGFEPRRVSAERMREVLAGAGIWPFFWSSAAKGIPPADGSELPSAIVVNFVLAEPFRSRGKVLLNHAWDYFLDGIRFLPRILADYSKVEIILTAVHDPVAKRMYEELAGFAWIRLHPVPVKYPIEHPLVLEASLRKAVSAYRSDGVIWTIDAQGIQALGACMTDGLPLHRRVVAVGGPGAKEPKHFSVPVGTPLARFIHQGNVPKSARILRGGIFMGEPVDLGTDCVQGTDDAFFVLPEPDSREFLSFLRPGFDRTSSMPVFASRITGAKDSHITTSLRGERRPCIACGQCESVCPVDILPQVLHRYLFREALDEAEKAGLHRCVDCNLCTFVCPSKIELQRQFAEAREQLRLEHEEAQDTVGEVETG